MANKLDRKEVVSIEEVLISNAIQQEAMLNLLEKKGLLTKNEVLEEIKRIRQQLK